MLKKLRTKSVEKEGDLQKSQEKERARNASQDPKSSLKMMFSKKFAEPKDEDDPLKFAETHKTIIDTSVFDSYKETVGLVKPKEEQNEEIKDKIMKGIGMGMMGMLGRGKINLKEVLNAKNKLGKSEEEKKEIDQKAEEEKKQKEKLKEEGLLSSSDEEDHTHETAEQRKKRMEEREKKKEKIYAEKSFLPEMTPEQKIRLINRIRAGRKNFKFYYETLVKINHKSMILQKAEWAKKEWDLPPEFCAKVDEILFSCLPFPIVLDKCNQLIKDNEYDKLEVPVKKLSKEEIMKLYS